MQSRVTITLATASALITGLVLGYLLAPTVSQPSSRYGEVERAENGVRLPDELELVLDRFTLVNRATNEKLEEFMMLGGDVLETFVLSFEDRYGGLKPTTIF